MTNWDPVPHEAGEEVWDVVDEYWRTTDSDRHEGVYAIYTPNKVNYREVYETLNEIGTDVTEVAQTLHTDRYHPLYSSANGGMSMVTVYGRDANEFCHRLASHGTQYNRREDVAQFGFWPIPSLGEIVVKP